MMEHFDVIVIGAGIIGSSTAYHLAKDAKKTLLLEQYPSQHVRGSSHGYSRTLRRMYSLKQWYYNKMVEESIPLWRILEAETASVLFRANGSLSISIDPKVGKACEDGNNKLDIPYRKLSHEQLGREFPMLVLPRTAEGLMESQSGVVLADKALRAFQEMFRSYGGVIRDMEEVTSIIPGKQVVVESRRGRYTADSIVITAGAWANKILSPLGQKLPLTPLRVSVLYWKIKEAGIVNVDRFPLIRFPRVIGGKYNIFTVPEMEFPGLMKICVHHGPPINADDRDTDPSTEDIKVVSLFIKQHMPFIDHTRPAIVDKCFYTMTEDEDYILDHHPRWNNIIIGAGFSGHGFKSSPRTGKILSDMVLNRETGYDMTPFSIAKHCKRFTKASL